MFRYRIWLAAGVLAAAVTGCHSKSSRFEATAAHYNVGVDARPSGFHPNPWNDLPPAYEKTFADVEKWLRSSGYGWKKEEIDAGRRKIVCVDFMPSLIPG